MKWVKDFRAWLMTRRAIGYLALGLVAATALLTRGLSEYQIVLIIAGVVLQSLLLRYGTLYGRSVSLEYMSDFARPVPRRRLLAGAVALLGVAPLSALHPLFAAALIVAVFLAFAWPFWTLWNLRKTARARELATAGRLAEDRFDVVFYVAGPSNVGYQINQWIPVAERMGLRACICLRRRGIYDEMIPTTLPVIYARRVIDVEAIMKSGPRVVLYPANFSENTAALRHPEIQHFFINHGESDKLVNQTKLLMAYDKLLVAGPLAERRLVDAGLPIRPGQVQHVGRPQVEIFLQRGEGEARIRRILYAPTWEGFVDGANYSSVSPFGLEAMKSILADPEVEVRFKPHPFTGLRSKTNRRYLRSIAALKSRYPNFSVVNKSDPIYDCMNWCDLMIADVGSVVNDFLATGKPIVVCSTRGQTPEEFVGQNPTSAAAYLLEAPAEAGAMIKRIDEKDSMAVRRAHMRRESLGDFPEGSIARFTATVAEAVRAAKSNVVHLPPPDEAKAS